MCSLRRQRSSSSPGFEFCDAMGDICIHSWGDVLTDTFEQAAIGMVQYMCQNALSQIEPKQQISLEIASHDLQSLFYKFLSEVLCVFSSTLFAPRHVRIVVLDLDGLSATMAAKNQSDLRRSAIEDDCDESAHEPIHNLFLKAVLEGDLWVRKSGDHVGTEVKAVTYHHMNIELRDEDGLWHAHTMLDL